MPVTINASTSSGFIATSDTSGSLELQANGTTKATVGSTGLSIGQYNPSASLITSGTTVNSTSGTSIDFTGIPSWVKRVSVLFNRVSTNGSANLIIRLGTSSGIESTGYYATFGVINASSASQAYNNTAFEIASVTAGRSQSGIMTFATLGSNVWVGSGTINGDTNVVNFAAGDKTLGGTLDRVRISTTNGTDAFDNGSINILYE